MPYYPKFQNESARLPSSRAKKYLLQSKQSFASPTDKSLSTPIFYLALQSSVSPKSPPSQVERGGIVLTGQPSQEQVAPQLQAPAEHPQFPFMLLTVLSHVQLVQLHVPVAQPQFAFMVMVGLVGLVGWLKLGWQDFCVKRLDRERCFESIWYGRILCDGERINLKSGGAFLYRLPLLCATCAISVLSAAGGHAMQVLSTLPAVGLCRPLRVPSVRFYRCH